MNNDERYWIAGGKKPVPTITSAASAFIGEHADILEFSRFTTKAFLEGFIAAKKNSDGQSADDESSRFVSKHKDHERILQELILTRTVDNYLSFIVDLLALIYKIRPEMLRTSEQERVDFILRFSEMDQLRSAIAEKRVERLSYLGVKDLVDYIKSNMSFSLFEKDEDLNRAALIVEMRNIVVHARGKVSGISAKRFSEFRDKVGERIDVSFDAVRELRQFLENSVFDIDLRATAKFGLPTTNVPKPPDDL